MRIIEATVIAVLSKFKDNTEKAYMTVYDR